MTCVFVQQHNVLIVLDVISVVLPKVWVSTSAAVRNICHTWASSFQPRRHDPAEWGEHVCQVRARYWAVQNSCTLMYSYLQWIVDLFIIQSMVYPLLGWSKWNKYSVKKIKQIISNSKMNASLTFHWNCYSHFWTPLCVKTMICWTQWILSSNGLITSLSHTSLVMDLQKWPILPLSTFACLSGWNECK